MAWWKKLLIALGILVGLAGSGGFYLYFIADPDIYVPMFARHCGGCHGEDLEGTDNGKALVGTFLREGDTLAALIHSIEVAHPDEMFGDRFSNEDIKGLAIFVAERRQGLKFDEFKYHREIEVPTGVLHSQRQDFRLETYAQNLGASVYSIQPLPDGSVLLTEREGGLSIISPDGVQSAPVSGTPLTTSTTLEIRGLKWGIGWLLDVAIPPSYEETGWVYLHYTHLCDTCGDPAENNWLPVSMNRVDRGHIRDGAWVDVENIWSAPPATYNAFPDTAAGGRIAFDGEGHVFLSVGMKSIWGGQDLDLPYGKILRLNEDGSIPADNPYAVGDGQAETGSVRPAVWTYGHRTPQGLEWNRERHAVWNSEMGPRGGDEINELLPGRNYGWPYHSLGLEYTGDKVERHKLLKLEFDDSEVEQTLVDITPSPAASSFAFYHGDRFPGWENNVLLGSLKGSSLFRYEFDGRQFIQKETLISDLARIRDVEVGFDGLVYLLLEADTGAKIVRLLPAA